MTKVFEGYVQKITDDEVTLSWIGGSTSAPDLKFSTKIVVVDSQERTAVSHTFRVDDPICVVIESEKKKITFAAMQDGYEVFLQWEGVRPDNGDLILKHKIKAKIEDQPLVVNYVQSIFKEQGIIEAKETFVEESIKISDDVNHEEESYLKFLREAYVLGEHRRDRTGVGCRSIFAPAPLKFNLRDGRFPLLTSKKLFTKSIMEELFWFLRGEDNIKSLQAAGVTIWDEWSKPNGDLGPVYGWQWRRWPALRMSPSEGGIGGSGPKEACIIGEIDQIEKLVEDLQRNPLSRRHILSAWNVGMIHDMQLPPCHMMAQFYVDNDNGLHCQMYQRSADLFLGVPFNIASYALLTYILAAKTNLNPASLTMVFGDAHVYDNHADQVKEQIQRTPRPFPTIVTTVNKSTDLKKLGRNQFMISNYNPLPSISAPVAV